MGAETDERCNGVVAGLIVADGAGRYLAIASDDLRRYRVPATWVPAVAALTHGTEGAGDDLQGYADASVPADALRLLIETVGATRRHRPATQRLEAWAVLR